MTTTELYAIPPDEYGWRRLPNGTSIKLGTGVTIGSQVTLGDGVIIGDEAAIGNKFKIGRGVKIGNMVTISDSVRIGKVTSVGDWVTIGKLSTVGESVTIGDLVNIADSVKVGQSVKIADRVSIGKQATIGRWVQLGKNVILGDKVVLGDLVRLHDGTMLPKGVTSDSLNRDSIAAYAALGKVHKFTKWVTKDRMSPIFDGGTPLHYPPGAIVEATDAVVSDQQCAPGLHVLEHSHRPEWYGLCGTDHDLIPITVEVASEDICFAGVATMRGKLRVRRLRVLE